VVLIVAALVLCAFYWFPIRRWFARWGADDSDLGRAMPGDAHAGDPTYQATLAVTIAARPEHIWPWLLQMGYRRGGLYSYDWLDRLFGYLDRPSATQVLPEFQHLNAGDEIPIGRAGGFPIKAVEPQRALVLAGEGDGFAWVWQFGIYPIDPAHTKLVSRNLVRTPRTAGSWLFMRIIEPAAFLMTRRMLLGLKERAEALARLEAQDGTRRALDDPERVGAKPAERLGHRSAPEDQQVHGFAARLRGHRIDDLADRHDQGRLDPG
jgi:hypothetical protein